MIHSKYEKMLKRLLAQKEIENKGPKRRDTIRHNNNKEFSKLIKEVIEENKNNKNKEKKGDKNKNQKNLQKKERKRKKKTRRRKRRRKTKKRKGRIISTRTRRKKQK